MPSFSPEVPYKSWEAVAGYFDGDSGISITVGKFVLSFELAWVDSWEPQIDQLISFLREGFYR